MEHEFSILVILSCVGSVGLLEALVIWFVPIPGKLGSERVVFQFFCEPLSFHKHVVVGYNRHFILVFHIVRDNYKVRALQRVVLLMAFIPKELVPNAAEFYRIKLLLVLIADWAWTGLKLYMFVL